MKICCFSAKPIKAVCCVLLLAVFMLALGLMNETQVVTAGYAARKVPIYYVDTTEKKIAITFDAAWGADKTQQIVDICKQKNIKATFFLVGFWVKDYPEMVKVIDEAGMEIGTHSNTHPKMSGLSEAQIREELTTSINLIKDITKKEVRVFRPPFGDYNDRLISVCESMKLQAIQWDVDSLDWKGLSAGEIMQRVGKGVRPGSIILCHNNSKHIVDALPTLIDTLKERGYSFVTVGDLLIKDPYVVDNNGMQKRA